MKNYLAGLFLIIILVSCNEKKENDAQVEQQKVSTGAMGVNNNGVYEINGLDTISAQWQAELKERFVLSDSVGFSQFEIVKTKATGDKFEDCYLLLTHTSDKHSAIAVILELKDDQFYFYDRQAGRSGRSEVIMCSSELGSSACMPEVVIHKNKKLLVCSSQPGCQKMVSEVQW